MSAPKAALSLLCLALLAACSPDYSAIRSWSDQAREIVEPPLADAGAPRGAGRLAPAAAGGGYDRREALASLLGAASTWLKTLATLADDGRITQRENPLTVQAGLVEAFDGAGSAAILALGEVMADGARRNWRAPDLGSAVERGDAPFQAVAAALARQIDALVVELPDPGADVTARYAALLAERPAGGLRAALDELQALRQQELLRRARSEAAWRAAIQRIGEGHALLKARSGKISQAETARLVRAQETELRKLALQIEGR